MLNLKDRIRAAGIHFSISATVAALGALLVFVVWYPYPYSEISGGRELFFLVVAVDVVLGPLITLAIFDRRKGLRKLRLDFAVIGLLQLAGLTYGLWTVFIARPVHLVFEYDRFRVVHAVEVPVDLIDRTPAGLRAFPVAGPTLLSLRPFASAAEGMDATMAALQGQSLSSRPDLWRSYDAARSDVLKVARPMAQLEAKARANKTMIDEAVRKTGRPASGLAWVPMVGRKSFWTVIVDRTNADVLAFLPLDSF